MPGRICCRYPSSPELECQAFYASLGETTDCENCSTKANWPLQGNLLAFEVFRNLCTKLNMDFGLGPYILDCMGISDQRVINKVALMWAIYCSEKEKPSAGNKP